MEVLLDTNFIISCIKRKINFMSELEALGFKIIIPREVYQELKDLRQKVNRDERLSIEIALSMFEKREINKITLGKESVDKGLIDKGKKGFYIATLDNAIKRAVPNRVVIESAKNNLSVERN